MDSTPELMVQTLIDSVIMKRADLMIDAPKHTIEILRSCAALNISQALLLEGDLPYRWIVQI